MYDIRERMTIATKSAEKLYSLLPELILIGFLRGLRRTTRRGDGERENEVK